MLTSNEPRVLILLSKSSSVGLRVFPQLPVLMKFFFMTIKCFFPLSIEIVTCFFMFFSILVKIGSYIAVLMLN